MKGGYARVLVEVAKGQSEESMLRKGKIYHHGSGGGYSVLLMLNFTENGDDYRAELWVWKFHKVYEPTSADRNANRMAKDDLCRKVEVYPRDLTDNWVLTMTRQDLHPRSNGPFEPETVIEIALSNLHEQLVETFEEIKLRDAELPFNPGRPLSHSDSEPSVNGTRVLTGLPSESSTSDSSDHSEYDPKA